MAQHKNQSDYNQLRRESRNSSEADPTDRRVAGFCETRFYTRSPNDSGHIDPLSSKESSSVVSQSGSRPVRSDSPSRLDLDLYPTVPESARPRAIVFDALRQSEVEVLTERGYEPVLLRTLPRRNAVEDGIWLARLMQGVAEGTVTMDKARSEGLRFELESKKLMGRNSAPLDPHALQQPKADVADPLKALDWSESRHQMRGSTTIVDPEKVRDFIEQVESGSGPRAVGSGGRVVDAGGVGSGGVGLGPAPAGQPGVDPVFAEVEKRRLAQPDPIPAGFRDAAIDPITGKRKPGRPRKERVLVPIEDPKTEGGVE